MRRMGQGSARTRESCRRRELLRAGGLGWSGLSLAGLLRADADVKSESRAAHGRGFGKARSCILLYLVGGPPQHETFDPKPEAPSDVRGSFKPISTPVDGLQVCELLPRLARIAPKYAVIRSMATDVNAHTGSGFLMLTGRPNALRSGESIPPASGDAPHIGALIQRLLPARGVLPSALTLPELIRNNPGIIVAGQNGGFMGPEFDPLLVDYPVGGLQLTGLSLDPVHSLPHQRLERRRSFRELVAGPQSGTLDTALTGGRPERADAMMTRAFDLLTSTSARQAFDLSREPVKVRAEYGTHKFGQACLLARRLVEAGVRLVTVNWPREPNDLGLGNPVWDTHSDHDRRTRDHLAPPMDIAVSGLLNDLDRRGLLDDTLVVCMGEFGRTPKFNVNGGRDHWGHVFSVMLAGGGIRGGTVYGASDRLGAYPETDRVGPEHLHATIYHLLGLPRHSEVHDVVNRPWPLYQDDPIRALL